MEALLNEAELNKMVFIILASKYILTFKNNKKIGSLYIQKKDLFSINLFSLIERLKRNEIDEIKYSPNNDELISINMIEKEKYIFSYYSPNIKKIKELIEKMNNIK